MNPEPRFHPDPTPTRGRPSMLPRTPTPLYVGARVQGLDIKVILNDLQPEGFQP